MSLVDDRRGNWKERLADKLEKSKDPEAAMISFLEEFIYYSRDSKDLRRRMKKVLQSFKHIFSNINATRKNEFNREELDDLYRSLTKVVHKLDK
jgi:hypothetical protein